MSANNINMANGPKVSNAASTNKIGENKNVKIGNVENYSDIESENKQQKTTWIQSLKNDFSDMFKAKKAHNSSNIHDAAHDGSLNHENNMILPDKKAMDQSQNHDDHEAITSHQSILTNSQAKYDNHSDNSQLAVKDDAVSNNLYPSSHNVSNINSEVSHIVSSEGNNLNEHVTLNQSNLVQSTTNNLTNDNAVVHSNVHDKELHASINSEAHHNRDENTGTFVDEHVGQKGEKKPSDSNWIGSIKSGFESIVHPHHGNELRSHNEAAVPVNILTATESNQEHQLPMNDHQPTENHQSHSIHPFGHSDSQESNANALALPATHVNSKKDDSSQSTWLGSIKSGVDNIIHRHHDKEAHSHRETVQTEYVITEKESNQEFHQPTDDGHQKNDGQQPQHVGSHQSNANASALPATQSKHKKDDSSQSTWLGSVKSGIDNIIHRHHDKESHGHETEVTSQGNDKSMDSSVNHGNDSKTTAKSGIIGQLKNDLTGIFYKHMNEAVTDSASGHIEPGEKIAEQERESSTTWLESIKSGIDSIIHPHQEKNSHGHKTADNSKGGATEEKNQSHQNVNHAEQGNYSLYHANCCVHL
jgi:hypothetical protein